VVSVDPIQTTNELRSVSVDLLFFRRIATTADVTAGVVLTAMSDLQPASSTIITSAK
jgi:hypothetical protein